MAAADDLRAHVVNDAKELIASYGIYAPLQYDVSEIVPEQQHVADFLKRHLERHIALIVMRLHETGKSPVGRTGVTASIETVLNSAEDQSCITPAVAADFRKQLTKLRAGFGADDRWQSLRSFRNAELAHSLSRVSIESDSSLRIGDLLDLAHGTLELVIDIEYALGRDRRDFSAWHETWFNRGTAFWLPLTQRLPEDEELSP